MLARHLYNYVYLEFLKVFDLFIHFTLLNKMKCYAINNELSHQLIESYFKIYKQSFPISKDCSELGTVKTLFLKVAFSVQLYIANLF